MSMEHKIVMGSVDLVKTIVELTKQGKFVDPVATHKVGPSEWIVYFTDDVAEEGAEVSSEETEAEVEVEGDEESPEAEADEVDLEAELESLTKKVDLLAFAEKNGVEVPEDITQPASIKKHLKESL